jgi:UbiD family decarboxylase
MSIQIEEKEEVNVGKKDVTSMRGALEYLDSRNEVLHVKEEVDPIYEIAGIEKSLEKGPILLFEKIKGYPPGYRILNGSIGSYRRLAIAMLAPCRAIPRASTSPMPPPPPTTTATLPSNLNISAITISSFAD